MSTTASSVAVPHRAATFLRHGLGMAIAMVAGMVVYVAVVGAAYGDVERARLAQPELYALGMAAAMCVPMVAWMRRRGHAWRLGREMTAATALPYAVFVLAYWVGGLTAAAICPLACAVMLPAMLAAMLYRLEEYG